MLCDTFPAEICFDLFVARVVRHISCRDDGGDMRTLFADGTETVWRMGVSLSVPLSFSVLPSAVFYVMNCDTDWPCSAVNETSFSDVSRSFSDSGIPAVFSVLSIGIDSE